MNSRNSRTGLLVPGRSNALHAMLLGDRSGLAVAPRVSRQPQPESAGGGRAALRVGRPASTHLRTVHFDARNIFPTSSGLRYLISSIFSSRPFLALYAHYAPYANIKSSAGPPKQSAISTTGTASPPGGSVNVRRFAAFQHHTASLRVGRPERRAAGALKVFIYLCSCNRGQPFAASILTVAGATGINPRSVISALSMLRKHHLVTRIWGRGNQPNHYAIPLPKRQETAAPPTDGTTRSSPGLKPARPPAATARLRRRTNYACEREIGPANGNFPNPDASVHSGTHRHLLPPDECPGVRPAQTSVPGRRCPPRKVSSDSSSSVMASGRA